MKNILAVLCLLFLIGQLGAQEKVIDKSSRRTPKWVNGIEKDYIITVGGAPTIDEAKNQALMNVKEQIVNSVAVYVQSTSDYSFSETTKDNVVNFKEQYNTNSSSQTADMPFIKGVSINKVEDFYWEKVRNKKTDVVMCYYHIKYPFSEQELKRMMLDYEKEEMKLNMRLVELEEIMDNTQSVDELTAALTETQQLTANLIDQRKISAEAKATQIRSMIKQIKIIIIEERDGFLSFGLELQGRKMNTAQTPKIKSNCAIVESLKQSGDQWNLEFSTEGCYEDESNYIEIQFTFKGTQCKKKILIDVGEE